MGGKAGWIELEDFRQSIREDGVKFPRPFFPAGTRSFETTCLRLRPCWGAAQPKGETAV